MKIVYASTAAQKRMLADLISHMYTSIFPRYFNDREITEFLQLKVLEDSLQIDTYGGTLDEVFKGITSIQTIIHILEISIEERDASKYAEMFNNNVKILEQSGLFFPFTYEKFFERKQIRSGPIFSAFSKSANELLI